MASLDWEQTRQNGVTLVELVVSAETTEWIQIESRLEPVWPPRRQGVPVEGWDDTGYEGELSPERPLVLGYASPAPPLDPPAQLQTVDPAGTTTADRTVTGMDLIRTLGESSPPRDAVPGRQSTQTDSQPSGRSVTDSSHGSQQTDSQQATAREQASEHGTVSMQTEQSPDSETIEPWFGEIEQRIERAERLAAVSGVEDARGAIQAAGGIESVRALKTTLDRDREQLDQLTERQRVLTERLDAIEIPLSTLERVA